MTVLIGWLGLSIASATNFTLNVSKIQSLWNAISQNIIPIHFVDNGNNFGGFLYFSNNATEDVSLLIKSTKMQWDIFTWDDIVIGEWNNSYTIMDRNLGAQNVGDNWYYFKWWNNKGFTTTDLEFWTADVWMQDSWVESPCPTWYHLPSKDEWQDVYDVWCAGKGYDECSGKVNEFKQEWKFPSQIYWSSNKVDNDKARIWNNSLQDDYNKSGGWVIRCFKNPVSDVGDTGTIFTVSLWDTTKECKRQLQGFYYNAERWDRLWPLDEATREDFDGKDAIMKNDWSMEWGLYTLCRPEWYSEALQTCQSNYAEFSTQEWEDEDVSECVEGEDDYDECIYQQEMRENLARCIAQVDVDFAQDFAYYGQLTWKMSNAYWWETFGLIAGAGYSKNWRWYVPVLSENSSVDDLIPNFTRWQNQIPIGFVYDYNGWVGFAWCEIVNQNNKQTTLDELISHQYEIDEWFEPDDDPNNQWGIKYRGDNVSCTNIWIAWDSLIKLIIEWLVWMDRESDLWVVWNQVDSKMQYFSSSDISTSTLMNYAKQKTEIMCRWKWKSANDLNNISSKEDVNQRFKGDTVCIDLNSSATVSATVSSAIKDAWKTLVVKNGNVIINPFTNADVSNTTYYDMFINGGNLIINETDSTDMFVFTKEWFILGNDVAWFKEGVSVLENSEEAEYDWSAWVAVWAFIRWNFIVDGKVKAPNTNGGDNKLKNKYFIHGKFSTRDSFKDWEKVFAWRCSNGYTVNTAWAIDDNLWKYCPPSVYQNASLVVIDQNYKSPLYW